jgi:ATP-binding cassette subfamily B protein
LPATDPAENPKTNHSRNIRLLLSLAYPHRGAYLGALCLLALATLALYATPQVTKGVIDGILLPATPEGAPWYVLAFAQLKASLGVNKSLLLAAGIMTVLAVVALALMYLKGRISAIACEQIIRGLRQRVYNHLQHLPASYHDKAQTGDLVQRCTSDVETVRGFYNSQLTEIARAAVLLGVGLPLMFLTDWRLALVAIALLPPIVYFSFFFFGRVQGSFKAMDEAEGAMTAVLQENLTGIRVVRAFARQQFETDRFAEKNRTHQFLNYKMMKIMALYWATSDLMGFAQMALVLLSGAYMVFTDRISVGTMVLFIAYLQLYLWPVRHAGRTLTDLGKSMVAVGRIAEILDVPRESEAAEPVALPSPTRGHIRIQNLSFAHGAKTVLDDISLDIPAGSTIALLGPSGSGKSTLVQLLLRLYDYDRGSITLDGVEISNLPRAVVRKQFGVVMQEPFLFGKSVKDNIRLGRFDAPDADIIDCATASAVHEAIMGFGQQYETIVGERGVTLSGGQRQRVAIARALLRDAPIVILDDALSAVDTHTESNILAALKRRAGKHTTLLIAHRLSTLQHADQIAVLEHGKITQLGTHDQLVNRPGLYRKLWNIQTELEEELEKELAPTHV